MACEVAGLASSLWAGEVVRRGGHGRVVSGNSIAVPVSSSACIQHVRAWWCYTQSGPFLLSSWAPVCEFTSTFPTVTQWRGGEACGPNRVLMGVAVVSKNGILLWARAHFLMSFGLYAESPGGGHLCTWVHLHSVWARYNELCVGITASTTEPPLPECYRIFTCQEAWKSSDWNVTLCCWCPLSAAVTCR